METTRICHWTNVAWTNVARTDVARTNVAWTNVAWTDAAWTNVAWSNLYWATCQQSRMVLQAWNVLHGLGGWVGGWGKVEINANSVQLSWSWD